MEKPELDPTLSTPPMLIAEWITESEREPMVVARYGDSFVKLYLDTSDNDTQVTQVTHSGSDPCPLTLQFLFDCIKERYPDFQLDERLSW
jgi:hypothetical protein